MSYYAPFYNPMANYSTIPQNGFQGQNYAPQGYAGQQRTPQQTEIQSIAADNSMIWVLGKAEAESYPVAPNNSVVLWDKSQPIIYVKSANMQGVPSLRVLDFVERSETSENTPESHVCKCGDKFVTKGDFEALERKFDELAVKYEALAEKSTEKPKAKQGKSKEVEE